MAIIAIVTIISTNEKAFLAKRADGFMEEK